MDEVKAAAVRVSAAREALATAEAERDDLIRGELAAGATVRDLAEAGGVSVPRVYQIRDGRR